MIALISLRELTAPPVAYLLWAVACALFTANAYRPLVRRGPLSVGAFFAGWIIAELPLQHLGLQAAATMVFARAGAFGSAHAAAALVPAPMSALETWSGRVGLLITLGSWVGLVGLLREASRSAEVMEAALVKGLGADYHDHIEGPLATELERALPRRQLLMPFATSNPRVRRVRNLEYGTFGRRNRLNVYQRRDQPTGCPVLIQVHGGAWMIGNKDQQGQPLVQHLTSLGWVCVAINYRLSPRVAFPDHIIDVKRAIAWVKANIARYGGDPSFVVITGGSAGGHLSALAALTANEPSLQPGFEEADTSVQACVPFYGVYDFTNRKGVGRADMVGLLERFVMKRPFGEYRADYDHASPMTWISAKAPPFFVIHGANDTLVPVAEARLFVELLRAASQAKVAYAELPQAQHAFEVFASVRTRHVIRGVARFLAYVYSEHRRVAPALAEATRLPIGAALASEVAEVAPEVAGEIAPQAAAKPRSAGAITS